MPRYRNIVFTIPRIDDDSETHTFELLDNVWSVDDTEITDSTVIALVIALVNAYADLADADKAEE